VTSSLAPVLALCAFLCVTLACKTTRPKDDTVILVDATPLPTNEGSVPAEPVSVPQQPSLMSEVLPPVRGGARVLPPYGGMGPACKMALLGDSPVAKACSARGQRGAVELMQTFVKRAKAEGFHFECVDCHVDEDDYMNLRPQADAEFRKLLFLARPE
jgi:hypothetical protein